MSQLEHFQDIMAYAAVIHSYQVAGMPLQMDMPVPNLKHPYSECNPGEPYLAPA